MGFSASASPLSGLPDARASSRLEPRRWRCSKRRRRSAGGAVSRPWENPTRRVFFLGGDPLAVGQKIRSPKVGGPKNLKPHERQLEKWGCPGLNKMRLCGWLKFEWPKPMWFSGFGWPPAGRILSGQETRLSGFLNFGCRSLYKRPETFFRV